MEPHLSPVPCGFCCPMARELVLDCYYHAGTGHFPAAVPVCSVICKTNANTFPRKASHWGNPGERLAAGHPPAATCQHCLKCQHIPQHQDCHPDPKDSDILGCSGSAVLPTCSPAPTAKPEFLVCEGKARSGVWLHGSRDAGGTCPLK